MRGVTGGTLLKLLDFMYNGEVNVERANIEEFLQFGEELRVEGLCEKSESIQSVSKSSSITARSNSISAVKPLIEEVPTPAPSTKQREKSERKKVRMEKKKRKATQSVQKVEALSNVRGNKRKENHVIEKLPPEPSAVTEEPGPVTQDSVTPPEPEPVTTTITHNDSGNKFDVYELGDSSEENETFSLRGENSRTPRKKAKKSLEELKDEAINRDVLTMDPGEAHGILKLVENLHNIEENSEDLNVFVSLLNQLILKSAIGGNVLHFCGICQKSLKSKPHMLNHIESSHVNGVYHKCSECNNKFKTRGNLSSHKLKAHKQLKKEEGRPEDMIEVKDQDKDDISTVTQQFENNISGSDENSSTGDLEFMS